MAKDENYIRMIHTARWIRLRKSVLSEHPLCERCAKEGRFTPACEVHHINPVEEALTLIEMQNRMFDKHNLMALCHDCHVKTHTEMGRSGKIATQKRNKEQLKELNKIFFGEEEKKAGG